MKRMLVISLVLIAVSLDAQVQLPVWNVLQSVISNPNDGDTLDGKFAAFPYVAAGEATKGVLKYDALQTVRIEDHWTLHVYARIPSGCSFYITAFTDSSNYPVLYEYKSLPSDNEQAEPIDTVLQVDNRYSYKDFTKFAVVRTWSRRQTFDSMYVDALVLIMHEPVDTVDVRDTVPLSVKPPKKTYRIPSAAPRDILWRPADTLRSGFWFVRDSLGKWRLKFRK